MVFNLFRVFHTKRERKEFSPTFIFLFLDFLPAGEKTFVTSESKFQHRMIGFKTKTFTPLFSLRNSKILRFSPVECVCFNGWSFNLMRHAFRELMKDSLSLNRSPMTTIHNIMTFHDRRTLRNLTFEMTPGAHRF